jgi:DNA-binding SARP family transcriptional activator
MCGFLEARMSVPDVPVAFGLLGPLLVADVHGTAIRIPQAKHRIIMAALLLRANATVSADQLADALWEDKPPPNAPAVIRTYVARLRRTLGQAGTRLVSRPAGYAIEVRDPGELDLDELERLRAQSRAAAEAGQWERAEAAARTALDLWRGTPLEDIPSAALHLSAAERLDELRLQLAVIRIDAELHLGREHYLITEIQELAREHPLREHIQAQLMLAYYRCGRQADALEVYRKVRMSLVDELGIEPGLELRDLHQRILAADRALSAPRSAAAMPGWPGQRRALPGAPPGARTSRCVRAPGGTADPSERAGVVAGPIGNGDHPCKAWGGKVPVGGSRTVTKVPSRAREQAEVGPAALCGHIDTARENNGSLTTEALLAPGPRDVEPVRVSGAVIGRLDAP